MSTRPQKSRALSPPAPPGAGRSPWLQQCDSAGDVSSLARPPVGESRRSDAMRDTEKQAERERIRTMLVALNMRGKTGPMQAAAYLQRSGEQSDRCLFAKAMGTAHVPPYWTPSALNAAYLPLTQDELVKAQQEMVRAQAAQAVIVTWQDRAYPANLRNCESPPPVLYVKGNLLPQDQAAVAIVGSRNATAEYMELAADLAYGLAQEGVTIVSGLARGIDRAAHQGALEAGGRTLAVLGSGVDIIYPPQHEELARRIEAQGAVLSFFPLGTPPEPYRFPARNWVIAGLSLAVVVVQGKARSGAEITANAAARLGREVMAVPGPVDHPLSQAPNGLIRDGAKLVTSAEEILAVIRELPAFQMALEKGLARPPRGSQGAAGRPDQPAFAEWTPEGLILAQLAQGAKDAGELARTCSLEIGQVQAALTRLELAGKIVSIDGGRYRLQRRRQWVSGSLRA